MKKFVVISLILLLLISTSTLIFADSTVKQSTTIALNQNPTEFITNTVVKNGANSAVGDTQKQFAIMGMSGYILAKTVVDFLALFIALLLFAQYLISTRNADKRGDNLYLVKLILTSGEYSITCNEQLWSKIITWHQSDENNFIIEKPNGYLRISKDILRELTYCKLSAIRQSMEPILYILKYPIKSFDVFKYVKLITIALFGIVAYMVYADIPLTTLGNVYSDSYKLAIFLINEINVVFYFRYLIYIVKNYLNVTTNKTEFGWSTYGETMTFKLNNSMALNGILIMLFSVVLHNLV